ncbi:hypothetical protein NC652_015751 [Populus alba x Populus x berolinensis]|nr:hypothetical protein NC652_015751 [Populus alba x Populus x berolinensis]
MKGRQQDVHASSKEKKNKSQVTEEGRSGSVADWSCLLWLLTVLWEEKRCCKEEMGRALVCLGWCCRCWPGHSVGELRLRREAYTLL